ncbi:MAG: ATP-dependent DNA helicase [Thermodesulfobacteriota bacterium]
MAEEVARALAESDTALVEAGTGTGKTMAYLVPALQAGYKTVISTGTKNLQEQIFFKDIPFIRRRLGTDFKAAYLKGRENYLCLHLYKAFLREPTFPVPHEAVYLDALQKWAASTKTGDRAELTGFPEEFLTWSDLSAPGDRCLGSKCPEYGDCFLWKARRQAAAADVVVVNHHLFMADLSVRAGGYGEVIPDYEAVVFDEAHHLEEVATQHFGLAVSSWRLARLKRDAERAVGRAGRMKPDILRALTALGHLADRLARDFFPRGEEIELWAGDHPEMERLRDFGWELAAVLDGLAAGLESTAEGDEEIEGLAGRTRDLGHDLRFILNEEADRRFVYWAERRGRGLFLRASPIDVAPFLAESLFGRGLPLVFTSATLTAGGSFDYFRQRLGLPPEVEGLSVESPFDYQRQSLLYVPRRLPAPGRPEHPPALAAEIRRLLELSRGRAFVLFTSYRNLNYVAEKLAPTLPWPCLVQGQAPRHALLEEFKRDVDSVLLATHSFWQGVDVPGESLSAVIIDKLPFPRPDRPLVRARADRLKEEGLDPFYGYSVPEAVITLKQGLGRLIRTKTDRGLLAVLDSRLLTRGYGRKFLESLPPSRLTHDLEEVARFFNGATDACTSN